ncbi:acetylglutamate kinase [Rubritalea profundi]|uniref:acetylglutamate kinase n=1 Tax=Rubritalea profundi TaxID=1658618 RepID=UPI001F0BF5BF|nr:acetylglutamate kinase [Rubritalea profundi]
MAEAGLKAEFIGGFRVTSPEAITIVEKTLTDILNPGLVDMLREFGGKAVGVPGTDVFIGERIKGINDDGEHVDIGRVGQVVGSQKEQMLEALNANIVPVISPLASELGTGKPLNVNADLAAAALAKDLRAAKLIYLSDVPGLMQEPSKPETLIPSINTERAAALIADGTISGGMIPKINSALDALNNGVDKVHFIDGRQAHSLLLEIFTNSGIGTEITK